MQRARPGGAPRYGSEGMTVKALITGAGGLIGSACARLLAGQGWDVLGLDNDLRRHFFGPAGSTAPTLEALRITFPRFRHLPADVRDRQLLRDLLRDERPDFIIHTAAQPSYDRASAIPYEDFD